MRTVTRICKDCREKFDVNPDAPRLFAGICDICSQSHEETYLVGEDEFVVVKRLRQRYEQ